MPKENELKVSLTELSRELKELKQKMDEKSSQVKVENQVSKGHVCPKCGNHFLNN